MVHIILNTMFCTHVEHSPTKTVYIKYYMETRAHTHTHTLLFRKYSFPEFTQKVAAGPRGVCRLFTRVGANCLQCARGLSPSVIYTLRREVEEQHTLS